MNERKGGNGCLSSKIIAGIGASVVFVVVGAAEKLAFKYSTFFFMVDLRFKKKKKVHFTFWLQITTPLDSRTPD